MSGKVLLILLPVLFFSQEILADDTLGAQLEFLQKQQVAEAETKYLSLARKHDLDAMFNLGKVYGESDGGMLPGKFWLEKAAISGNAEAAIFLGFLNSDATQFSAGGERLKYYLEAEFWFKKIAERKDPDGWHANAMYWLGGLYEKNLILGDHREAYKWFRLAQRFRFPGAQYNQATVALAVDKHKVELTDQQIASVDEEVRKRINLLTSNGITLPTGLSTQIQREFSSQAKYERAIKAYDQGDFDAARERFLKKEDDAYAQLWLGHIHSHSVKHYDLVTAKKWYQRAANTGIAEAWYQLAYIDSKKKNLSIGKSATHWEESFPKFKRAADLGHASAQLMMGHMLSSGIGVPENDDAALKWYYLAKPRLVGESLDSWLMDIWLMPFANWDDARKEQAQREAEKWELEHPNAIKKWPTADCPIAACSSLYARKDELLDVIRNNADELYSARTDVPGSEQDEGIALMALVKKTAIVLILATILLFVFVVFMKKLRK